MVLLASEDPFASMKVKLYDTSRDFKRGGKALE
jgi:hypothetical protein